MRCPNCSREDTNVIDSRSVGERVRRRRQCKHCDHRFTTREELAREFPKIIKRDQRREDYQPQKLHRSIDLAVRKTEVPASQVEELVSNVEKSLLDSKQAEFSAVELGKMVMERLRDTNHVAYVRYASVYLAFADTSEFIKQVKDLQSELARQSLDEQQLSLDL